MPDWRTSPAIIFLAVIALTAVYYLMRYIFSATSLAFNELVGAFTMADEMVGVSNETVAGSIALEMLRASSSLASILANPTVLAALIAAGILTVLVWHEWE